MPITTAVQFYLDPVCPWTWITSRWLVEVADHRDLQITWNQFSLRYHNKTNPAYDWLREEMEDQHPGMRVVAATKQHHGNAAAGRLNTTLGTLIHHDGDDRLARLAEGIAAAGLLADLIEAGSDAGWDAVIIESTGRAVDLVGKDAGIPIAVIDGAEHTYFDPVLAPTGDKALELWDAYIVLGSIDGIYEIKRTRDVRPLLPPRPVY